MFGSKALIVMFTFAVAATTAGVAEAVFMEDFEYLASDPTWTNPDNNWEFLEASGGSGTINNGITGQIITGGPSGKYGKFTGPDEAEGGYAVTHVNDYPDSGTFFFNALFENDPNVAPAGGQNRFWLGTDPGSGANDYKKPQFYFNKSSTEGKLRLQLYQGDTLGVWIDDNSSLDLDTWYQYVVSYDYSVPQWSLEVKTLGGVTVFDDGGAVYDIDTYYHTGANYATWEKRYGSNLYGPSFAWNIDNINIPEPVSLALLGLGAIAILCRRSAHNR